MVITEGLSLDTLDLTDADLYVSRGYPWKEWDLLRHEAPVYWYDRPGVEPFWAITSYEDVLTISKDSKTFVNSQRLRLAPTRTPQDEELYQQMEAGASGRDPEALTFNDMDPPEQGKYRNLTNRAFAPRALLVMESHIEELAKNFVADFAHAMVDDIAEQGSCDFVVELASKLPLAAICEMFGVPRERHNDIFIWSERMMGAADPEYQDMDADGGMTVLSAADSMFGYIRELIEQRRAEGVTGDDLVSALMRAEVDGEKLTEQRILSYIMILLIAGNETTRNATTGGLMALLQHPEQRDLLVANPDLVPSAVEEILRWTSPVLQFARTCVKDIEIGGQQIKAGQAVGLYYPSANRDETIFEDPYRFDITRDPNDHLAFGGYGAHFCLGANLARWELRAIFRALLRLLPDMELAGDPARLRNIHVGGIKHLPVTYTAQTRG